MKRFNKYKLRLVLWLLGILEVYHSMVCTDALFPQISDPNKLKKLLINAKKNVPFYKINLPDFDTDSAHLIAEFEKVDFILDKKILKEELSSLLDPTVFSYKNVVGNWKNSFGLIKAVWKKQNFLPISTSGYSSKPLTFYTSKALAVRNLMLFLSSAKHLGWHEGEVYMACMQGGMYAQANKIKLLMSLIGALPFVFKEIDEKAVKKFAHNVNKYKPTILSSTPSFLSEMAILLKKYNVPLTLYLKAIHSSGEMLFDHQRQQIEEVFGAKVYNIYASNEIGLAAIECEAQDGLHVFEEYVLLENDAENRILATVLDADFMPLIKYNTGDNG